MVTVCPPRDSNTALYHDLAKVDNQSLSDNHRQTLKEAAYKIFMEASHKDYVKKTLATPKPADMDQIYQGFVSLPKPYNHGKGFEVKMWNTNGTITTPFYGNDFIEEYYKEDRDFHIVLELPDDIKEKVGSGSLNIQLTMDTRESEGWEEHVRYIELPKGYTETHLNHAYKLHTTEKNWTEAETECQREGGHLASVTTEEVKEVISSMAYIHTDSGRVWLGGKRVSGEWNWSDNSTWRLNYLEEMRGNGRHDSCVVSFGGWWYEDSCEEEYEFICQMESTSLSGKQTVNLQYKKNNLGCPSFHVWYEYKAATQKLLDTWEDKRMTGFKLSWRIENPTFNYTLNTSEVGKSIQTPGLGGVPIEMSSDHVYEAVLMIPKDFPGRMGNGTLVIDLDVDKGHSDEVVYGFRGGGYSLYREYKTWTEAEAHCRSENGQLVSIHSEDEQTLAVKVADGSRVWLNGRRKDGEEWHWTDNSTWGFTNWKDGCSDGVDVCVRMSGYSDGEWCDKSCNRTYKFLCQGAPAIVPVKGLTRIELKKDQVTYLPFYVLSKSPAESKQELKSSNDEKKMAGFKLNWSLKDSNGSQLTEHLPIETEDWNLKVPAPRHEQPFLVQLVQLAMQLRMQNMTKEQILDKIIQEKVQNIRTLENHNPMYEICSMEQAKPVYWEDMVSFVTREETKGPVSYDDIVMGFEHLHAVVYCPPLMVIQLFRFVNDTLSFESSRTVIQTMVNLFQSGVMEEDKTSLTLAKEFYLILANTLQLQYGKVLLATGSKSQLQTVIDNDWPFFANYTEMVKTCLEEDSRCDRLQDIFQMLGNMLLCFVLCSTAFLTEFIIADNEGYSKERSLNPVHLVADDEGKLPPSAFVPFCSYQADNGSRLGQERAELGNLTMCNTFEPIILEGKLCYSLDITKMEKNSTVAGKAGGLFLILDPNPYLQNFGKNQTTDPKPFEIYINTLGQYRAYEGGAYAMRTLKKITATESFTHLPDSQKKCLVHNKVECQAKKFIDKVKSKCKCIPWALQMNNTEKACTPEKGTCVAQQNAKDKGCLVPCTGIFADVTEELFLQQLRQQKYSNSTHMKHENELKSLTDEYRRYKQSYVEQLVFDPEEEEYLSRSICSQQTFTLKTFPARWPLVDAQLEIVYIYFGTETYDEYKRDVKVILEEEEKLLIILVSVNMINHNSEQVTTEAALGLIGGTMGLLTGFSILSGVEIIYYLIRFY